MAIQRAYTGQVHQGPLVDSVILSGEILATTEPRQGWLGVMVCAVPIAPAQCRVAGQHAGLLVERVAKGSPAARAGLRAADVLLMVNGRSVTYDGSLRIALTGRRQGDTVCISLLRDGRVRMMTVVPQPM